MPSRLLLLLAVACFSSTVWAQQKCGPDDSGPPSCEASGPASQSDPKANAGAGNPVNLISGNKYQREVDLPALPGVLGLEIVRHYNSALAGERSPSGVLGRGWRLSYETELHAFSHSIQILQADGRHLQFSRDPQQPNLCASPDPAQGTVRIKTTAQGEEYTWHWPDGRQLHFDRQGRLEEIRAPTGEALSLLYAPDGKLLRITDPQGRQLRLEYLDRQAAARNERFRGVQAIDSPVGRFVYHHDDTRSRQTLANLTAVDYPSMGEAKSGRVYHYEAPRFAAYLTGISVTDGSKAPTRLSHYGYDDNGLAISSEHGPQSVRLDRHPGTVRITDDAGRQTHFDYAVVAGQYRILEVRGAGCPGCGPAQRRYGYDPLGRRQTQTRLDDQGQAQETIKTTRDPQGRIRTIERIAYLKGKAQPAQRLAEYRYQGEPLQTLTITRPSVVAGRQMLTQLSYDDHGQVTAIEQSGWSPSPAGQPQRIERSTRYRYADIGGRSRLSEIDGPLANGPKNDPSDSDITQYHYGTKGRVATIVYPGWRELQIDNEENGRPRARIVRFEGIEQSIALGYDAMDRLTRFTGPDGNAIALSYDAAGILKPVSLPDGRILSLVSAEKLRPLMLDEQSGFTLGGAGSVAQEAVVRFEANGKTAERLIDDFGRVVAIHNPGQNWQTAQYDTADRLIQIIDPRGAEARAHYDLANRLQQVERLAPGASEPESIITLAWSGPRKTADTITDVDGRRTTRYLHDARGRIASVTLSIEPAGAKPITLTQRFEHDAEGRLLLQTLPSGQRLHYAYGERGQITITAETGPQWLMDWLPERWRPGVTLAERPPSSDVRADAGILSELPAEAIEPGLSEHAPGEAFDAAGYPGRLTTSQGELRLIWNAAGQLVEVTNARGRRVARYAYDAQGRRVSKVTNQGTVYFFHDGTRLTAVADGQGAIKSEYAYQGLRPVAWLKPDARTRWYQMATLYRLQTDHRGALVAVQSETGEALWTAELDAWGRLRNPADTRFDPKLRLVAQYADDETGLFYHLARYYDPAQGRFISPDPAGIADSLNNPEALRLDLTAYAGGLPRFYVDPDGAAKLQYLLIDAYGGAPTNPSKSTLATGVDPRMIHFAFYLTDIAAAPGEHLLYDPNGTFSGLNDEGALAWSGGTGEWNRFQSHYGKSISTGAWAVIGDFDDTVALELYKALSGRDPLNGKPVANCDAKAALAYLPDLPEGFYAFEHYAFPTYIHLLTQPIFFANEMPDPNDVRYVDASVIPWGDLTFDAEGNDAADDRFYSRKPHLPQNNEGDVIGNSGTTLGRGYDFGGKKAQDVKNILFRLNMSQANIDLLAGAIGKQGNAAAPYFENNVEPAGIELTREQQYLLFLQSYKDTYNDAKRAYDNNFPKDVGTTWDQLDPAIRDVIVDMRFRGDFKNLAVGREPKDYPEAAKDFRDALKTNTPKAMCEALLKNEKAWRDEWGVPPERAEDRMISLGYKKNKRQCS